MQFKHIVYMIEFVSRKDANLEPYYYIGSKSNCFFDGTNIIDKNGEAYFGSSSHPGYKEAIQNEKIAVHVLATFEDYDSCIAYERTQHIINDVVADTRFWNLSNACESTYSDPNYATVRHTRTSKTVRLPIDHPMITSGEYVGTTSGMYWYTNGGEDSVCFPQDAPENWYRGRSRTEKFQRGDEHYMRKNPRSKEEVDRIIRTRQQNMKENPEKYEAGKRNQRESASRTFKGVPKSAESNAKRSASNKNFITLKNTLTGECVRIKREEAVLLDTNVWKNPYTLAEKRIGAKWYNNGVNDRKIFPGDPIPIGFTIGRKKRNKQ